ncbi:MAG TPA: hypothetical protein VL550_05585 [Rhodocyclaceae bacterium]|nr:hypothetical protein [Rhodocyclaceae bacterium]
MISHLSHDAVSLYQDCAERARTYAELPFGKPGRLLRKSVHGQKLVYREVSVLSGDTRLRKLGPFGSPVVEDADAVFHAATWMPAALVHLREAGFYGAARQLEEPLIAAFNLGLFSSGAVLIGPLAYLFWLNELGARVPSHVPAAPDLELALSEHAVLSDAQADFFKRCIKTRQSRLHVHFEMADYTRYLQSRMRLPYEALLKRHCFMTHLHYLTRSAQAATALVGDYLVPVLLPSPGRIYWQKLHWSRLPDNPRAEAERHEALVLGAAIQRVMPDEIERARRELPVQWARQLAADVGVMRRLARGTPNTSASARLFEA